MNNCLHCRFYENEVCTMHLEWVGENNDCEYREPFKTRIDTDRNPFNWVIGKPKIGRNCWIGLFTILDGSGGLEIGNNVVISSGVHIYTHESKSRNNLYRRSVTIEDDVIIGANSVIRPGVTIKKGARVPACTVVKRDSIVEKGVI